MALLPYTHVLRRKTSAGYMFNRGLLVEGIGFMMVSPRREQTDEESGIYRILRDLKDCEILTTEEAWRRGWLNSVSQRRQMFEEAVAAAS